MGYMHISNLYKDQTILIEPEVYALEKIHGTSAHVAWRDGRVWFHSGGETHSRFAALFDEEKLAQTFRRYGVPTVTLYGEAYGGSQQKQAWRYGPELRFVVFDVREGDEWLVVPEAYTWATELGLEFVHFTRVPTSLEAIDAERDAASVQARRNGVEGFQPREGVVLRPLVEKTNKHGERIMAKHKRDEERETKTPRKVVDPAKLEVLQNAERIAEEWVTPTRLEHVLDKIPQPHDMAITRDVIRAMQEDVTREGAGEIVVSEAALRAIGSHTAKMFKERLVMAMREGVAA